MGSETNSKTDGNFTLSGKGFSTFGGTGKADGNLPVREIPKTDDNTNLMLWIVVLVLSGTGADVFCRKKTCYRQ